MPTESRNVTERFVPEIVVFAGGVLILAGKGIVEQFSVQLAWILVAMGVVLAVSGAYTRYKVGIDHV